jgi:hypothetical protein
MTRFLPGAQVHEHQVSHLLVYVIVAVELRRYTSRAGCWIFEDESKVLNGFGSPLHAPVPGTKSAMTFAGWMSVADISFATADRKTIW